MTKPKTKLTIGRMSRIAVMAALLCVASPWSIPVGPIPISLATLVVYLTGIVLGWLDGTIAVAVYLLIGAIGVPVFANFTGGMGILLGSTGGYIVGFILTALVMWGFERFGRGNLPMQIVGMLLGLVACYALGTVWFMVVYGKANGAISVMTALGWCVFPFIIPDLVKVAVACAISPVLRKAIQSR